MANSGAITSGDDKRFYFTIGAVVDISEPARAIGIEQHVHVTHGVWRQYIDWTEADTATQGHALFPEYRLADLLWSFQNAFKKGTDDAFEYELEVVPRDGQSRHPVIVRLFVYGAAGQRIGIACEKRKEA